MWSRLGSAYDPEELTQAVDDQVLVQYLGFLRPIEDLGLHRAEAPYWPGRADVKQWQYDVADWVAANEECRQDILELLRAEGPLPATEIPDTCQRTWGSTGWTNNKNVQQMLWFMLQRDEVAVASSDRPREALGPRRAGVRRRTAARSRRGAGGAGPPSAPGTGHRPPDRTRDRAEPTYVRDAGEPAVIEGVRGKWRVEPSLLDGLDGFAGRAALLSPFDRLVMDRKRLDALFGFDYLLEMYKPKEQRIWGYYALPILYGDRLVGKLDATAERDEGVLRVDAVHEDEPFTPEMADAVDAEIEDLAGWLGLEVMR